MPKSNDKKSPVFLGLILSVVLHSIIIIIIIFRGFNSPASIQKPAIISGRIITLDNARNSGTGKSKSPVKRISKEIQEKQKVQPKKTEKKKTPVKDTKQVVKTKPVVKPKPEEMKLKPEPDKKDVIDISENKRPKKEPEKEKREESKPVKQIVKKEDTEKKRQEFLNQLQNKKTKEDILSQLKKSAESKQLAKANTNTYDITAPNGDNSAPALNSGAMGLYSVAVQQEIASLYRIPPSIPTDGSLTAKVFFRSDENGEVYDLRLMESSGNKSFDEFCVRAIKKAAPLSTSPPPEILKDVKTKGIIVSFRNDPE